MDNRVFQLAEKIKQDMSDLIEDQKNGQHDIQYINACLCNSQVILEDIETIWDVNLKDYYVTSLLL